MCAAQVPSFHELPDDLLRLAGKKHEHSPRTLTEGASISRAVPRAAMPRQAVRPHSRFQLSAVFCRSLLCHYVRNPVNLGSRLLCYTALSLLDVPTTARPHPHAVHAVGTFCTPTKTQPASSCTLLAEDLVYSLYAQGLIFYRVAASDAALADGPSTLGAFTFVMLISYLLPFAAIPIFVYDKQFYLRESGLGLYATWVYTISQACAHHRHHSRHKTASPPNSITRRHTQHLLIGLLHAATGGQEETEPHTAPLPPSCSRRRRFLRHGCSR